MILPDKYPAIHYHFIKIGHDFFWDRFLEIIPATTILLILLLPFFLSFHYPIWVACFIIVYDVFWLFRVVRYGIHLIRGYRLLKKTTSKNWQQECKNLQNLSIYSKKQQKEKEVLKHHYPFIRLPLLRYFFVKRNKITYYKLLKERIKELREIIGQKVKVKDYKDIYHLVILATYKEDINILRQSINALKKTGYSSDRIFFILATEERDKERATKNARILKKEFGQDFGLFIHIMHPANLLGEVKGKGANITYAALRAEKIVRKKNISPEDIIVTTLDADTCVHQQYLWKLTYDYICNPLRTYCSYQPIPIYSNNIWDVPVSMSIISISCSFWQIIQSSRSHLLRNFSVHAQSLKTLLDTHFWSKKTVVEDGHQFWRTFMRYNGHHQVIPLFVPVYQDAVLGHTYWQTIRNQYLQLRRWSWGVTDFPFVVKNFVKNKKIPLWQKVLETWRVFEAPFSLATAPLVLTFVAWMPIFLNPNFKKYSLIAFNLPTVCGGLLALGMIGLVISAIMSSLLIPTPPASSRYRRKNKIILVLEWIIFPWLTIFFSSLPAVDAQMKLACGHYMEIPGFFVVEKIRKKQEI
jgi:hypothetical protein